MDRGADRRQSGARLHRDGHLADQVAGLGRDDRRAQDPIRTALHEDASESGVLAVEYRPVHLGERLGERLDRDVLRMRVGLVHSDVRDLRLGVRAPGDDQAVGRPAPQSERMRKKGVLDEDLRHRVGGMGELEGEADVARGVDARVARAKVAVHRDAGPVVRDAGGAETEALDIGGATGADEDGVDGNVAGLAALGIANALLAAAGGHGLDRLDHRVEEEAHAVSRQAVLHHFGGVRVFARKDMPGLFERRHRAAEAGEGLGHLAADRPGPDHGEARRQLGERKDGFVGQIARLGKAGNRGRGGAPPGADGGAGEVQGCVADLERFRPGELSLADVDVDPQSTEALGGVDMADRRAQPAHPFHGDAEVLFDAAGEGESEGGAVAGGGPDAGSADHPLRRDTPDVEAVASHQVAFDQRDLRPEARRHRCADQSRGAGAHHHEVVAAVRGGVPPVGGMNVGGEQAVEGVVRRQQRGGCGHGGSLYAVALRRRARPAATATKERTPCCSRTRPAFGYRMPTRRSRAATSRSRRRGSTSCTAGRSSRRSPWGPNRRSSGWGVSGAPRRRSGIPRESTRPPSATRGG